MNVMKPIEVAHSGILMEDRIITKRRAQDTPHRMPDSHLYHDPSPCFLNRAFPPPPHNTTTPRHQHHLAASSPSLTGLAKPQKFPPPTTALPPYFTIFHPCCSRRHRQHIFLFPICHPAASTLDLPDSSNFYLFALHYPFQISKKPLRCNNTYHTSQLIVFSKHISLMITLQTLIGQSTHVTTHRHRLSRHHNSRFSFKEKALNDEYNNILLQE
ncbi:hypothetical protein PIB30_046510 [Stylosanthes scabra]|uniref:Uncharacterized protein n=1 Tax=Stylosanthes scabra TaxID=79078 RepID=A0ABU6XE70_9FABA|nr:hypothetical protein [Stylosanthes scabra]